MVFAYICINLKHMKLNYSLVVIFLMTTLLSFSQKKEKIKGNKNVTKIETPVNDFNRIVIGEKFKVDLIEGNSPSVFIETDENLHEVIVFTVNDSTLSLKTTKRITSSKKLNIKISYTSLLKQIETIEDAEVSSLTSINLPDLVVVNSGTSKAFLNIKSDMFKYINNDKAKVKLNLTSKNAALELNDNSNFEALINSDSLVVDMAERSDAKIEGNLEKLDITAEKNATFNGKELTASIVNVMCNENTDIYLQAIEELVIDASDNAEVYIYENPKITINRFADLAKLHKKQLKKK